MKRELKQFLDFAIDKAQLMAAIGENLHTIQIANPVVVSADNLMKGIRLYRGNFITLQRLTEWVNVIWFTDLFTYDPKQGEAIASVMEILETMDESDANVTDNELSEMMECLLNNVTFHRK